MELRIKTKTLIPRKLRKPELLLNERSLPIISPSH